MGFCCRDFLRRLDEALHLSILRTEKRTNRLARASQRRKHCGSQSYLALTGCGVASNSTAQKSVPKPSKQELTDLPSVVFLRAGALERHLHVIAKCGQDDAFVPWG
jgi:hypothetical protein